MVSKVCHECGLEESALGGRNSFNNHLKSHEIRSHDCTQCGKSFPKRTTHLWHMRKGLFFQSEEVVEATHSKFDIFLQRFKVIDVESEKHGERLLECVLEFNTKDI